MENVDDQEDQVEQPLLPNGNVWKGTGSIGEEGERKQKWTQ